MAIKKSILDEIILNIEGNPWTVRDACTGCIVFGMTGSGKSSGPLYKIAHKFLTLGYGGVVFRRHLRFHSCHLQFPFDFVVSSFSCSSGCTPERSAIRFCTDVRIF